MEETKAVYAGTFDPITNGHLDVINRGRKLFKKLIVAIAINPEKKPLFTVEERLEMLRSVTKKWPNVSVDSFDGLAVDYVRGKGAKVLLRGIRTLSDFEYEFQMALINRRLAPTIETVFIMTSEENSFLSSRLTKEAASLGGDVSSFVPQYVHKALKRKFKLP